MIGREWLDRSMLLATLLTSILQSDNDASSAAILAALMLCTHE